ncbi:MAG: hypothetical protein A3I77_03820 [Gammaproteobacteria bacterium RIFCSPLOWO2_02_FULL_42_14]|nr:MAG: hypothetical protein A3B71_05125 [Gammaproteobacteria bacterium RIFCSPHIGHO2_02_FULL_42_43]OGT28557.1 MAG: hypothetical protein A2624_04085 [Gammaproteobacteria bacterium RIFCSPHIGHO2_01_FULL_42_8]OGT51385.1 MAG: hypothetical protein A3E54_04890 [Gammaproteobacteria bacterium RIFCSPHIGHO2_12_FULL_41_25]OGT62087.1 MAG: hypothetical protein A3I77_03820 [Gammaproteobacteria bacterium RIFCSPLOWO2_02_FULL_42_14]OGT85759.1 MAG: hypothetical protein A3G86_03515 [Gammaproteobacteria bacterium R
MKIDGSIDKQIKIRATAGPKRGLLLIHKIIRKFLFTSRYICSLPIAIFAAVIFPFYKIKLVALFSDRIGHYALNTELALCTIESEFSKKKCRYLFYAKLNSVPICNSQLHLMWKRVIFVLPFPVIAEQVDTILKFLLGRTYKYDTIKCTFEPTSGANDPKGLLKKTSMHLKFLPSEIKKGEQSLVDLGLSLDAKIVCLMVRDSAYLNTYFPGNDWSYHNFRDVDVSTFKSAALYLAEKGYCVVRMGKAVAKKFDVLHDRIIDYATSHLRCDFLDIFLLSRCTFFISTVTGLDCVSQIFRRPGVFTNVVLPGELLPWYPNKLFIPKKIRNRITNEFLPFCEYYELINQSNGKLPVMELLKKYHLEVIQNTEEEILEIIKEMEIDMNTPILEHIDENTKKLQKSFWDHYIQKNTDGYYIKVGADFLRKNFQLL